MSLDILVICKDNKSDVKAPLAYQFEVMPAIGCYNRAPDPDPARAGIGACLIPTKLIAEDCARACACRPPHHDIRARADGQNRHPRTATKSLRERHEGPWVWPAYREERCLFSSHIYSCPLILNLCAPSALSDL